MSVNLFWFVIIKWWKNFDWDKKGAFYVAKKFDIFLEFSIEMIFINYTLKKQFTIVWAFRIWKIRIRKKIKIDAFVFLPVEFLLQLLMKSLILWRVHHFFPCSSVISFLATSFIFSLSFLTEKYFWRLELRYFWPSRYGA